MFRTNDFKVGDRVKIVDLNGWDSLYDHPDDLLGKYGTVVSVHTSIYVPVRVEGVVGTYYEKYHNDHIFFLPDELEQA